MKDLQTFLRKSKFHTLTKDKIIEIKQEWEADKKWKGIRRKFIDEFVKESSGNPTMNALKLKHAGKMRRTRENNWLV